jgi:hypothetical protein
MGGRAERLKDVVLEEATRAERDSPSEALE